MKKANGRMLTTEGIQGAKCLVAGGSGFIGRHLTKLLIALGAEQVLIVHKNSRPALNDSSKVKFIECDLGDRDSLERLKNLEPLDYVFNLCGVTDKRTFGADIRALVGANINSVINLTQALNWDSVKGAVHVGSCAEYGNQAPPHLENLFPEPTNPYSWSKAAGTLYAQLTARTGQAKWSIARPFLVYGPGQRAGGSLVVNLLPVLSTGGEFTLSDAESTRDFIFVEDAVQALVKLALSKEAVGETFNICSGRETPVVDLAELMRDLIGKGKITIGTDSRQGNFLRSYGGFKKIAEFTGWQPQTQLETGLKLTIDAYQRETVS